MSTPYFHTPARPSLGCVSLKQQPDHFQVSEVLSFDPTGDGEHEFLRLRKTGLTTQQVAKQISRYSGVPLQKISWAGLKDRHAITEQWFCVTTTNCHGIPDWQGMETDTLQVLQTTRNQKKLRRGQIRYNEFLLTLTHNRMDESALRLRIDEINARGFPNYFGEQRFGIAGGNLQGLLHAIDTGFKSCKRFERGLYLSAGRALLFNQVLARRVQQENWNRLIPGDICMLDVNRSVFAIDGVDAELERRVRAGEIHPTGPLCGVKGMQPGADCAVLEQAVFARNEKIVAALARLEMQADRRALRVMPQRLRLIEMDESKLRLAFALKSGAYATSLVNEIAMQHDAAQDEARDLSRT